MNQMSNKMKKKPHSPEFKFKVAIEAIRGDKTTAELCSEYGVVNSQIFKWKKALLDSGKQVFREMCREIPMKERKAKVQTLDSHLSKRARAFLLTVNLSSCYVKPKS